MDNLRKLLEYICCPGCKADLTLAENSLQCFLCNRTYEIRDGVPILMLPKRSRESLLVRDRYECTGGGGSAPSVFPIIYEMTGDIKGKTILNIGCSRGDFERKYIFPNIPEMFIGIDIACNAICIANEMASGMDNVAYLVGDAETLPLKRNLFDKVIISEVIEHTPNPDECIREMKAVLRENGQIILSTPNYFNLVGIFKKAIDHFIYKGQQHWTYAQLEPLERFSTPFSLRRQFMTHNLIIQDFRGSELYLGFRKPILLMLTFWENILYRILNKMPLWNFYSRSFLKYFGVVQYYKLSKHCDQNRNSQ